MNDYTPPPDNGLTLLHQDTALLVVDKPSGLLSVPGRGEDKQDSLLSRVRNRWPEAECVHRLDMETSGVMVLARGKPVQRDLNRQFQRRHVSKQYVALVNGHVDSASGEIELPLICDWPNRPRQKVDFSVGKPSHTRFTVTGYDGDNDSTRLSLFPKTGRSHQLRVHLQALGHCILGDSLYASPQARRKATRLMLHATGIRFSHPLSGEPVHYTADEPF